MTCETCNDCNSSCTTCSTTTCTTAPLTYWGVGTEIAWDMVTAIINNVNVQQAILDLVGDLSWARSCDDVADCISWNPTVIWELTTLINSLMWDLNCDDVASCLESIASINALAWLIAGSNAFKTAIVNLIASETDVFTCDDVATCISSNAWTQTALDSHVATIIKRVWPITWSSWTTKNVTDADCTTLSQVLSIWVTTWTQAWNWSFDTTSWNILFTSTAAENVTFYYVLYI